MIRERIAAELLNLVSIGEMILYHELSSNDQFKGGQKTTLKKPPGYSNFKKSYSDLNFEYNAWYSKSIPVIRQLIPERLNEFESLYKNEKRKSIDHASYTISDYLLGVERNILLSQPLYSSLEVFKSKFSAQIAILKSCTDRIDFLLNNIETLLQHSLFKNELEAAKELLKKNHLRPAGVLAGVTLESHLKQVCQNKGIFPKKRNPTISDYNEALRNNGDIDTPIWREIQWFGDIRNYSAHPKDREPTKEEIQALIMGCEKVIAKVN